MMLVNLISPLEREKNYLFSYNDYINKNFHKNYFHYMLKALPLQIR